MKQPGILGCKKKIGFDGYPENWPVFCIELTGIFIQRGILELISPASGWGSSKMPPRQNFQSVCLGMDLKMVVNNLLLMCLIHEGNMGGIRSWYQIGYS